MRKTIAVLGVAFVLAVAGVVSAAWSSTSTVHVRVVQARYQGKTIKWWAHRTVIARTEANERRHALELASWRVHARLIPAENVYEHAARVAAVVFGVDAETLIRKGRCESVNWTKFLNVKSKAAGPWQFLLSTWRSTPFAIFSPYDPVAAAMGAAWMHAHGRGGEWVCR